ncbi:2-oxoglutarate dehydrogenase E1 component [Thioflexithrix psekupsensis]|uniref:2-oxoglutarate dehydrogenase E1 component n=1 Tax=Thioflexithrix psekupsensis TaxID=1570016 RepID=A0A251X910_9GAMM|nr:2-oxoglutarate dehydrogenase E1 component [Thioflexithrix psekupsensis]OUD14274.1 2-oxoglutarate dehydrogenase E1 component [Thioflexithrix psekupsensis]
MDTQSYLYNADFIDELYETYLIDPQQVDVGWRQYFARLQQEQPLSQPEVPHLPIQARYTDYKPQRSSGGVIDEAMLAAFAKKQAAVLRLINAYRFRGHQRAQLDPLNLQERHAVPDLDPEFYGLTAADMNATFDTGSLYGTEREKLSNVIALLKKVYCNTIGAEYMHITDTTQKRWIQQYLEGAKGEFKLDVETKKQILERLTAAQGLEDYLHTQYVGQKRFSLEGGESTIPLLDDLIQRAGGLGVAEVVIGMAHRGRLNVLVNILGKRPKDLFSEFEGKTEHQGTQGSGDVKYHQGFSSDVSTPGGNVHLALAFNPSHLEIINPVVEGSVRARQERRGNNKNSVLPILIHGDAAFAGQGVILETLNLAETRGYGTGGTVHIVINNQIGFTTSDPLDSRSTLYCTDVAKMVQSPIFHVNGDDPEAVIFVTRLAMDYRMAFNKDVVIDLVCYRRHGHNEADEPAATQPVMYRKINQQVKTQALYAQKLAQQGIIGPEEGELMLQQYRASLKTKDVVSRPVSLEFKNMIDWRPFVGTHWTQECDTTISLDVLQDLIKRFTTLPDGFQLNRSVAKLMDARRKMGLGELPLDWGCAETLAYASLLEAGTPVRLSGQDCGRGTFAHRHAVLHEAETGETYLPLRKLSDKQANFLVINSLLSEEAVLGFEFGFSSSDPHTLVIWEAQFGDFANGAQVVIDQFISSSESKWGRLSGLVMLLPHGYDGQGPEHSSARLERYLQLCAEDNIQVCNPTTPAQCFHMLRRQMLRPYRKPLIVMTPKSLLRHKRAVSHFEEFTDRGFQVVIDEVDPNIVPEKVNRLLFCSGKVYYDLVEAREEHGIDEVAIIRLEQLYPYPKQAIAEVLARYPHVKHRVWVQEEPRNQGAWWYMRAHMDVNLGHEESGRIEYAGRPASASPAVGSLQVHRQQLLDFLNDALQLDERSAKRRTA